MSKPKPIQDDTQGQLQVVLSFRAAELVGNQDDFYGDMSDLLEWWFEGVADLDVAVRVIGAGGEASEDEGRYDAPRHHTTRDKEDVDTGGKL